MQGSTGARDRTTISEYEESAFDRASSATSGQLHLSTPLHQSTSMQSLQASAASHPQFCHQPSPLDKWHQQLPQFQAPDIPPQQQYQESVALLQSQPSFPASIYHQHEHKDFSAFRQPRMQNKLANNTVHHVPDSQAQNFTQPAHPPLQSEQQPAMPSSYSLAMSSTANPLSLQSKYPFLSSAGHTGGFPQPPAASFLPQSEQPQLNGFNPDSFEGLSPVHSLLLSGYQSPAQSAGLATHSFPSSTAHPLLPDQQLNRSLAASGDDRDCSQTAPPTALAAAYADDLDDWSSILHDVSPFEQEQLSLASAVEESRLSLDDIKALLEDSTLIFTKRQR